DRPYVPAIYHWLRNGHWPHPTRQPIPALYHSAAFVLGAPMKPATPKTHPRNPNAGNLLLQTAPHASVQIPPHRFQTARHHSSTEQSTTSLPRYPVPISGIDPS